MKARTIVIVLVFVFLSAACQREEEPSTFTCEQVTLPHTLTVPAKPRWTNTEVYLEAGQSVQITAQGEVFIEDGRKALPSGDGSCKDAVWGSCSLEGIGWGTLLGRIEDGSPFVIGDSARITVEEAGCLRLGVNDSYYDDNSESYTVTIED